MPVTKHENPLNPPCREKVRHAAKADFPLSHTVTGTTNSSKRKGKGTGMLREASVPKLTRGTSGDPEQHQHLQAMETGHQVYHIREEPLKKS